MSLSEALKEIKKCREQTSAEKIRARMREVEAEIRAKRAEYEAQRAAEMRGNPIVHRPDGKINPLFANGDLMYEYVSEAHKLPADLPSLNLGRLAPHERPYVQEGLTMAQMTVPIWESRQAAFVQGLKRTMRAWPTCRTCAEALSIRWHTRAVACTGTWVCSHG